MRISKKTKGTLTGIVNSANGAYTVQLWDARTQIHQEIYNSREAAEQRVDTWCEGVEDGIPQEDNQPEEMDEHIVDSGSVTVYANTVIGQTKY